LLACTAVPAPPRSQLPSAARARGRVYRCGLEDSRVVCSAGAQPVVLALPFTPRALAARARGGAYVLGDDGRLARVSARGALSGLAETPLTSLATSRDFVCGLDTAGHVLCARDSAQDRVCDSADMVTFRALAAQPVRALTGDVTHDVFCLLDHAGRSACRSARAACARSCLAFPVCGRPRCIDPCPAASERGPAGLAGLDLFSSASALPATWME
jgi:hypothetical protein